MNKMSLENLETQKKMGQGSLKKLVTQKDLRFLLFGGKGGVGKTSSSAATAIWLAENLKQQVLILSTDPAHSLSDSFDQDLSGGEIVPIKGVKGLSGLEMDPKKEYSKYQKTMQESNVEIPKEIGFMMEGMDDLQAMTPPGTDETLAFSKVLEFIQTAHEYDTIIFDTAPTGHTLRLLHLPSLLDSFFGKMISFRMKMGQVWGKMKSFFKREDFDAEQDPLEQMKRLKSIIEEANKELTDPKKTSFVIVMISEMMAIYETERLLSNLYEVEIPCSAIIINQLFPENVDCKFCSSRREMQQRNLVEIKDIYAEDFTLVEVPLFPTEVRGLDKLRELGRLLIE
jgi:arsenite-transporting ATPase